MDSLPEHWRAKFGTGRFSDQGHHLIQAVHTSFSQHRPLALSPDNIWLVIAQGLGHHVAQNANALRHLLVRHEGRRELYAEVNNLSLASFEDAITAFSSQIRDATDPVLHETLVCDFSTTSPQSRIASEVVLMDTYSPYFTFHLGCVCGIPRITIEGTEDDWRRIRARAEVIATYDLEWWIRRVRPILDQFVLAAAGRPTPEFWRAIYKPENAYADTVVTGWLTDLFPYLGDRPNLCRNHALNHERHEWALPVDKGVTTHPMRGNPLGVSMRSFPSGISSVPLRVSFPDGSGKDMNLIAGFLAVQQKPSDLTLSPLISWCVTEPPPPLRVIGGLLF
jgi:hypothetical protein